MKPRTFLLVILTLTILALTACQASSTPTPSSQLREITINLTYIPNVQFAPFYVAIEKVTLPRKGCR